MNMSLTVMKIIQYIYIQATFSSRPLPPRPPPFFSHIFRQQSDIVYNDITQQDQEAVFVFVFCHWWSLLLYIDVTTTLATLGQ